MCVTRLPVTTATQITIFRIFLIPVFIGLAIYYGDSVAGGAAVAWYRWAAIGVFGLAALSDAVDGYVARHFNQHSRLGQILDPLADKLLLLSAIVTLSLMHWPQRFPLWFPLLVIFRDLAVVGGVALVEYLSGHKCAVSAHWTGKTATVTQIVAVLWLMLDVRILPIIWPTVVAAVFTAASGCLYLADGLRQIRVLEEKKEA